MVTTVERLGVVETKVANLDEKIDDLKIDVKDMHDCLDKTRDSVMAKLDDMYSASCGQHSQLAKKITELESFKQRWVYTIAGGAVVLSWMTAHAETVMRFLQ